MSGVSSRTSDGKWAPTSGSHPLAATPEVARRIEEVQKYSKNSELMIKLGPCFVVMVGGSLATRGSHLVH